MECLWVSAYSICFILRLAAEHDLKWRKSSRH